MSALSMYCDQCEQAAHNTACMSKGVCGKTPDVESLQKLLLYGVKGMAAYKSHARRLGKIDPDLDAFIEDALFATMTNVNFDMESLLEMVLECGRQTYRVLQLLDAAHSDRLGEPEVVEVREGLFEGPGILVTGHDMVDLLEVLEQCEGSGVNVYTHGEMLPAHTYPKLRSFECLRGHYGSAWQRQRWDFERFGGPILATTNCVLVPWETNSYLSRLNTTRYTAVPGATRIAQGNYAPLVKQALEIGSLKPTETVTKQVGWHYRRILERAPVLVEALESGQIRHLFVIGGCDGAEPGRNYFSKYAEATPASSVILTMGCGKYRIRDHEYGRVAGLPRLLDLGQCNDAFGAMQLALELSKGLGVGLDKLPLTIQFSWFEQKAVAVFLAFLHLGMKRIALGPSLPGFLTERVLELLVERHGIRPTGTVPVEEVRRDMARA